MTGWRSIWQKWDQGISVLESVDNWFSRENFPLTLGHWLARKIDSRFPQFVLLGAGWFLPALCPLTWLAAIPFWRKVKMIGFLSRRKKLSCWCSSHTGGSYFEAQRKPYHLSPSAVQIKPNSWAVLSQPKPAASSWTWPSIFRCISWTACIFLYE